MRRLSLALFAMLAACDEAPPSDPGKAESYAVRMEVIPAKGSSLQRIEVPSVALAAMRERGRDVRVFDGTGRQLAMALLEDLDAGSQTTGLIKRDPVQVYPVKGNAASLAAPGVAVVIEGGVARISGAGAPKAEGEPEIVAALLDTRKIYDPVTAVVIDADVPKQQPVAISLASSDDLVNWSPASKHALFRPDDGPALLNEGRLTLSDSIRLDGRYLRISWDIAQPVRIKSAIIETTLRQTEDAILAPATGAELTSAHEIRLGIANAPNAAGFRIGIESRDGVVPANLAVRQSSEKPWERVSLTTLRPEGSILGFSAIDLSDHDFRIEADRRTSGFSRLPRIDLVFDPQVMLVQFNGAPPYELAAGLEGAGDGFLPASELLAPSQPGMTMGSLSGIPTAKVSAPAVTEPISIAPAKDDGWLSPKSLLLWLVLLTGVAILGFAVIRLMRGQKEPEPQ